MALGIAWTCRVVLATVLVLSASWKLGHRTEFARAYRGLAPKSIAGAAGPALWLVAGLELLTVGLVMAGTWIGPALALAAVALVAPSEIAARDLLAPVTAGVLLGLIVVELPLIVSIATIHRRLVNRA